MPFWGLQKQLGIDVDSWLVRQSMAQPHGQVSACHGFEREWVECGHGLGQTRARRECQLEYEDFLECMNRTKLVGERGDAGGTPGAGRGGRGSWARASPEPGVLELLQARFEQPRPLRVRLGGI